MVRAMLHLAIVFAEMERERTLVELERVKATGKHLGRRKGVSRKRAEEIQNMRRRAGLSWGRIATISGSPQRHSMVVRLNTTVSVYQSKGFVLGCLPHHWPESSLAGHRHS